MPTMAILYDARLCNGCTACVMACREADGRASDTDTSVIDDKRLLAVKPVGEGFVRVSCLHCQDPSCASVCPVGAIRKQEDGSVTYDADRCMGCRYCMVACPFSVPRYEWSSRLPYMSKCTMCHERRKAGGQPACVEVCPTGALTFGEREVLLAEAKRRIAGGGYVERVYGETEVGGTSVLYLSDVPFKDLGLPDLPNEPLPRLTGVVLEKIPDVVSSMGVAMAGLWWIIRRREELRRNDADHS